MRRFPLATSIGMAAMLLTAGPTSARPDPLANRRRPTFQERTRASGSGSAAGAAAGKQAVHSSTVSSPSDAAGGDAAAPGDQTGGGSETGGLSAGSGSYTLGPGDVLEIEVWNRAEVEIERRPVTVTPDGTIFLPLLDDIVVRGKTITQLTETLSKLYDEYIIHAQAFVEIREYNSRQVSVVGEVKNAGRYILKGDVRLSEIIAQAGDFTKDASNMVRVRRPLGEGRVEVIDIDYGQINSDPAANIEIEPGDSIYVLTNKNIVYISGMVAGEGYVEWEEGLTAQKAVILAGGLEEGAAGGRAKLIREVDGKVTERKINVKDTKRTDLLEPGDIIHVPKSWF